MFEKPLKTKKLIFAEWKRVILELEISRGKIFVFESSIFQAYPDKIRSGIPRLTENTCCPIKASLENKILRDLKGMGNNKIYNMYYNSGGYEIAKQLNFCIFEESKTDKHGTRQYRGSKKPGLSPIEHDNTGFLLQSLLDFYHHLEFILKVVHPNSRPLETCIEQQTKIKNTQKRMIEIFSKEHPDFPKESIEQTYHREQHPDYVFLDGSFTDLRPFINLTRKAPKVFDLPPILHGGLNR